MSKRYIITRRSANDRGRALTGRPALAETDGVSIIARLDHGLLIDTARVFGHLPR